MISKYNIIKYKNEQKEKIEDEIATEMAFNLYVNRDHYITLMCSPKDLEMLGIGFLYFEGVINNISDIKKVNVIDDENICFTVKYFDLDDSPRARISSCGKGSLHYEKVSDNVASLAKNENLQYDITDVDDFSKEKIIKLIKQFRKSSDVFLRTGGVHNVGLFSLTDKEDDLLISFEDIGRHNAVDKAVGYLIKNNLKTSDYALVLTGRISSDLVIKAAKAKIAMIVSMSAPTSLGIDIARQKGVKLLGFVRGDRFNIYS